MFVYEAPCFYHQTDISDSISCIYAIIFVLTQHEFCFEVIFMKQNEIVHKCKQGHAHPLLEHFAVMDVHCVTAWNIDVQPKYCDPAASCVVTDLYQSWFRFARHQQNITSANIDSLSIRYAGNATQTRQSYRQVYNISRNLVGNKIVDHSDVVGASPVDAASTTSSFST